MNYIKKIFVISIGLISMTLWAQKPKDSLATEVIDIVKPYVPSISEAFKIKKKPVISEENVEKEEVEYRINSVPVASTFIPSKGKAKGIPRPKKERLYENYISAGFGNYTTPLIEVYMRTFLDRDVEFGVLLKHHSSQGDIEGVQLKNAFYDSELNLYYKQSDRDKVWKIDLGGHHLLYHWYGLSEPLKNSKPALLENTDVQKSNLNIYLEGNVDYFDSFFKGGKIRLDVLRDNFETNEVRARIQPAFELPISSEWINFQLDVDYLKGQFHRNYMNTAAITYNYLNLGISPNFEVLRDNLKINLGAKLYYTFDIENSQSEFKAYPNVSASYQLVEEVATVFAGATGGLHFNSYAHHSRENPYLSPNLYSLPTDEQYRAYGGLKGKLANTLNYLFRVSYAYEKQKPLYLLNQTMTDGIVDVEEGYEMGNSFGVVYDNVKTLAVHGRLSIDLSKEFTFGGSLDYALYDTKKENEAWNLPLLKATLFADYHKNKWTGMAKLFMVGDRNDLSVPYGITTVVPQDSTVKIATYVDLNAGLSYAFTDRLTAFAKVHNLLGTQYKRFYNYPIQGLQALAGITYKFDF